MKYFILFCVALALAGCGVGQPATPSNTTTSPDSIITITTTNTKIPSTQTLPISIQEFDRKIAAFNSGLWMCGDIYPRFTDFSPDNTWLASICEEQFQGGNLLLTNKDGNFWRMTDKQLFETRIWISFTPVKWSNDGKNLYFSTSHQYANIYLPETPSILWCFNGIDVSLVKVNLETGGTQFILGHSHSYDKKDLLNTYAFAISPSEKFLAYSLQERNHAKIIIRNLENKQETKLSIEKNIGEDTAVTSMAWAANESTLNVEYIMCDTMLEKEVSLEENEK